MARLYEYQGKKLLKAQKIPIPSGATATTVDEAEAAARSLGGEVVIRGNVIQKSPGSENGDVFGIALEAVAGTARDFHPVNSTLIENNTVICDRPRCRLVNSNSPVPVVVMNNTIVGADLPDAGAVTYTGNAVFTNRASAELPAFPELPGVQ